MHNFPNTIPMSLEKRASLEAFLSARERRVQEARDRLNNRLVYILTIANACIWTYVICQLPGTY